MEIVWNISEKDITNLREFVSQNDNAFVEKRISKNVKKENIQLDRNSVLRYIIICLLTSQQRSGPNSPVGIFARQNPFPLTVENIEKTENIEEFTRKVLKKNGLNRYINKIPKFFAQNIHYLNMTNWKLLDTFQKQLDKNATKDTERKIADSLNEIFSGFGPKQSRNLLQGLGLTKYEIPIDSRITSWLNNFGFPVTLSSISLQDREYYHFVSDGIQQLCEKAEIYPCVLDAAIFSSFDNGEWTNENSIF